MHDFVRLVIAARDTSPTEPDLRSYFERIASVFGTLQRPLFDDSDAEINDREC
jgi:hypothetical protein